MTRALDSQLGLANKTVMSQRDVPGVVCFLLLRHVLRCELQQPAQFSLSGFFTGTTRTAIPILVRNGVQALSFGTRVPVSLPPRCYDDVVTPAGVNGFSAPPGLPSAFVWRDNSPSAGVTDIIGMVHPGAHMRAVCWLGSSLRARVRRIRRH
jgi:hypothetical protein